VPHWDVRFVPKSRHQIACDDLKLEFDPRTDKPVTPPPDSPACTTTIAIVRQRG
jgi:hypothetical protein